MAKELGIDRKSLFNIIRSHSDCIDTIIIKISEKVIPLYKNNITRTSKSKLPNKTQMKHIEDAIILAGKGNKEELVSELWSILSAMGKRDKLYKSEIDYIYIIINNN